MSNLFYIFIGSGFGGILRFLISDATYKILGRKFPYGTFVVNATGCFLMGLLFIFTLDRFVVLNTQVRALLLIGFLGSYTTFSTFAIETINLFENGYVVSSFINVLANVVVCICFTLLGVATGRQL